MTWHLHGAIVTPYGTAANNRGENEGNITTLQKLLWKGNVHSTVSAEAIRWAIRYHWQRRHAAGDETLATNRRWDDAREDNTWQDQKWAGWNPDKPGETFIDDDVLGFMLAEGAKSDGSDEGGGKKKAKGTIEKRRGALEVTRAVSLTPFAGDITFNAKSGTKGSTSLYGTEVHATRYQYGFSLTPGSLRVPSRVVATLDALAALGEVAGNHSRFHYDFSPDALVLRWTHDPAPRLLYCFDEGSEPLQVSELVRRVEAGDIRASELYVGGALAGTEHGERLKKAGAHVEAGVLAVTRKLSERILGALSEAK